jgi:hypothetical protein
LRVLDDNPRCPQSDQGQAHGHTVIIVGFDFSGQDCGWWRNLEPVVIFNYVGSQSSQFRGQIGNAIRFLDAVVSYSTDSCGSFSEQSDGR